MKTLYNRYSLTFHHSVSIAVIREVRKELAELAYVHDTRREPMDLTIHVLTDRHTTEMTIRSITCRFLDKRLIPGHRIDRTLMRITTAVTDENRLHSEDKPKKKKQPEDTLSTVLGKYL